MTLCVVALGYSVCETKLMSFAGVFLQVIRLPCYGQRETPFGTCRSMQCVWATSLRAAESYQETCDSRAEQNSSIQKPDLHLCSGMLLMCLIKGSGCAKIGTYCRRLMKAD